MKTPSLAAAILLPFALAWAPRAPAAVGSLCQPVFLRLNCPCPLNLQSTPS